MFVCHKLATLKAFLRKRAFRTSDMGKDRGLIKICRGSHCFRKTWENERISSPEKIINFCILLIILENSNDPTQNPSWLLCCIPCEGHFVKQGWQGTGKMGNLNVHFTREGKQGICQKKSVFAQGIYLQHRKKLKIKGCTRVVVGYYILGQKKNKEMLKTEGTLPDWSVKA